MATMRILLKNELYSIAIPGGIERWSPDYLRIVVGELLWRSGQPLDTVVLRVLNRMKNTMEGSIDEDVIYRAMKFLYGQYLSYYEGER